jgi:PAS domain S-box-containing protein
MTTKDDEDSLLRSVALQNASSILIARQRAEQRQEAYLAEAQRLSRTGSFGWRVSTGEIVWSEETYRIFQYDRTTTPTVESVLQRFHPEDAAQVKQTIERASQDGKDFDFEHRLLMPDGSVKHVHIVAHAERDESGELEFVGAVMDTTESKLSVQALRRSEGNLAEAQRLTHTGSWVWRVAGRDAVHLSEEWYRIYGFDPEEGMPAWEERLQRVHPEDRAKWRGTIERAIGEKSDYQVEFRILLPDGTLKYIHTAGHPVLNASGDLVEFVGSATDITGRKRAEMLLSGEKRLLEMIARGDSRPLILDALCHLVEELASGSLSSILLLDPKTNQLRHGAAPSLPKAYTQAIDGSIIGPCVGSCGTAAYRAKPVIVSDIASDPLWADFRDLALGHGLRACWSTPILSSAGRVLGTFAIYYREPRSPTPQEHDLIEQITHLASIAVEREQAEEALRQAQADLAHVSRVTTMGELTASIAHEVNQPLTAVVNNANACLDLLPKGAQNVEEVREALAEIIDDTARASTVIMRVRQLAKRAPVEKSLLDLRDVVKDVLILARYESATRRITIRTDLPKDLPSVSGDRVQLQQVLLNLVVNGMDAMNTVEEPKRVLLICGRRETRDGMLGALLSVQDSGTGFKPGEMDRLFEAFYTTKTQGMGMGLAISRSIIEAHGGRLWAELNQGPGATFLFTLPAAPECLREGGPIAGNTTS